MRPRLLDLFCGAGGCSMGYHRAGFDVVGVDIKPEPRYPFTFIQGDALEYVREHGREFDAIHASPPCQAYSVTRNLTKRVHLELIPATRAALQATGKPYAIENVPGSPLGESGYLVILCGTMFGLVTPDGRAEIRRHRLFECSFWPGLQPQCRHASPREALTVTGHSAHGASYTKAAAARRASVICVAGALSQAIPPAYTEWLGRRMLAELERIAS